MPRRLLALQPLASRPARRRAFIAYVALVALLGGGSRGDALSLVLLRPLAVLFGTYALAVMPTGHAAPFRPLLWLFAAAAVAVGWQLTPLPPDLWQALPGRAGIASLDRLLGLEGLWRPASLSPAASWNALLSLAVPGSGLLLYLALEPADRALALPVIAVMAVASALLGVAQQLGGGAGPLYLYRITNEGLPVGLFANRNHQAVFLAAALPLLAVSVRRVARRGSGAMLAGSAAGMLILLVVLLTGSRAGLAAVLPASLVAAAVLADGSSAQAGRSRLRGGFIAAAAGLLGLAFIGYVLAEHSAVLERLARTDPSEELRYRALPIILGLTAQFWTSGAGAGAFALVYQRAEPTALLSPTYLNNAHNDWLQVAIELGVPGLVVLGLFLVVLLRALRFRLGELRRAGERWTMAAIAIVPLIFAVASLVDYPLRTPSLALVGILFVAAVGDPQNDGFARYRLPRTYG